MGFWMLVGCLECRSVGFECCRGGGRWSVAMVVAGKWGEVMGVVFDFGSQSWGEWAVEYTGC